MKTLLTTTLLLIALISYSQTGYLIVSGEKELKQDKVETIQEVQKIASKYFKVDVNKLLEKSVYFIMETEGKYLYIEKKRIVRKKNGKIKFRKFRK